MKPRRNASCRPPARLFTVTPTHARTLAVCVVLLLLIGPGDSATAFAGDSASSSAVAIPAAAYGDEAPTPPSEGEPSGGGWVEDRIRDGVKGLISTLNTEIAEALPKDYLGDGDVNNLNNFITRTPPAASYEHKALVGDPAGRDFTERWGLMGMTRILANAALALVIVVGGLNMMLAHAGGRGETYASLSQFIPRVVLGAVMVNSAHLWCKLLIDLNNGLSEAFDPRNGLKQAFERDAEQGSLTAALILLALLLVFVWLILKMVVRLAIIDLLILLSPLALLCWVLPQTSEYARVWSRKFTQTVFGQFLLVAALSLAVRLKTVVPTDGTSEAFQLLLWVATLAVAINAPSLFRAAEHHSGALGMAAVAGYHTVRHSMRSSAGRRGGAHSRGPAQDGATSGEPEGGAQSVGSMHTRNPVEGDYGAWKRAGVRSASAAGSSHGGGRMIESPSTTQRAGASHEAGRPGDEIERRTAPPSEDEPATWNPPSRSPAPSSARARETRLQVGSATTVGAAPPRLRRTIPQP